jgi:hypothetical protein
MITRLMRSTTMLSSNPPLQAVVLVGYYLAILGGVMMLGTLDAFTTPSFVYQGF